MEETYYKDANTTKNNIHKVLCSSCKNITKHIVLTSINTKGEAPIDDDKDFVFWFKSFEIIECLGCGTISFRIETSNSEEYDQNGLIIDEFIFPKRSVKSWNAKQFFNIPYNLRRIYRETIDCYNNENFTLCGAGVRALVEGLCYENGIIDGEVEITKKDGTVIKERKDDLRGKINGLYEKNKLTKENAEILHEHRLLGNTAIHDLNTPSITELHLALEILEHVFDNLYEIPVKANQLKIKRINNQPS